jgi:hypothetical protein
VSSTNRERFTANPAFLGGGGSKGIGNISLRFEFSGFAETSAALKQMATNLIENVYASMVEVVSEAAAIARADAPVDTGNLRANIFAEPVGKTEVHLQSMAPYSGYVNYGHRTRSGSFIPPQPFFSAAVEYCKIHFQETVNLNAKRF